MPKTATPETQSLKFVHHPHPSPVPADKRAALLANPGFGRVFSDHMVTIRYSDTEGWHDARVEPRAPIPMDPAAAVLHYAQEIFEGLKAYKTADGGATLFRPSQNAKRFQQSAERLAMPKLPENLFLEAIDHLVKIDRDWIPDGDGSLYIRPFMFANETFLGVKPSSDYLFIVIASSVGAYFKSGADAAVSVWVSQEYTRAAPGGTGAAKCGGNYAASLLAQAEAGKHGCDQVVFLDAAERKWIEELGGMNIFFVFDDGSMSTPPLGTILPGITRSSVLTLAKDKGIAVREEKYSFDQWKADAKSGKLREAFACGTAAVLTPIGTVRAPDGEFVIGNGQSGARTGELKKALVDIQRGRAADPHHWIHKVF